MSNAVLKGNASGTGTVTLETPNTNTDRTISIPDAAGSMVLDSATQTLTNKTIQGGTLTTGTAVSSTSGTSITFSSIPSWVKQITVMLNAVSTNGIVPYLVQVGSGSTSTSGYITSSGFIATANSNAQVDTNGWQVWPISGVASAFYGCIVLTNMGSNIWSGQGQFVTSGAGYQVFTCGNSPSLSGALDRVVITTTNGTDTFDAGTINIVYG